MNLYDYDSSWQRSACNFVLFVITMWHSVVISRCLGCSFCRVSGHKDCWSAGADLTSLFWGSQECICWHQPLEAWPSCAWRWDAAVHAAPGELGDKACGADPSQSQVFGTDTAIVPGYEGCCILLDSLQLVDVLWVEVSVPDDGSILQGLADEC